MINFFVSIVNAYNVVINFQQIGSKLSFIPVGMFILLVLDLVCNGLLSTVLNAYLFLSNSGKCLYNIYVHYVAKRFSECFAPTSCHFQITLDPPHNIIFFIVPLAAQLRFIYGKRAKLKDLNKQKRKLAHRCTMGKVDK